MRDVRMQFKGLMGLVVLLLVACGGGGGGSTPSPSAATLGGTAAKGIINKGIVVAEELAADGTVIAQVGSATTGADGSYTLAVGTNYAGGPILVTISTDDMTEMKCDVPANCGTRNDTIPDTTNPGIVDFGEWYKPGAGLTMTALVAEAADGDTIGVSITPYTDMATGLAMETNPLTTAAVY